MGIYKVFLTVELDDSDNDEYDKITEEELGDFDTEEEAEDYARSVEDAVNWLK